MAKHVKLVGRDHAQLLLIANRACTALAAIASQVTSEEGDWEQTEEDIGLPMSEIVEMAHDEMIGQARAVLDSIVKDFP